jgi:hypothetical protein
MGKAVAVLRQRLEVQSTWVVFGISLTVYVLVAVFLPFPAGMAITNGDEPHYLLSAYSLYYDRDLELINNYENGDYRTFYDGGLLQPHMALYKGRLVPLRPLLGMPLLILPAYIAGGRVAVLVFLNVLVAGAMARLYQVAQRYASSAVALGVVLFLGLTYPLIIYSHQIYPETPVFVIVTCVLAQILVPSQTDYRKSALLVGLLLGVLLQFHYKFAVLMSTLLLFFLWRNRAHWWSALRWSMAPIMVSALALGVWMNAIYHEISLDIFRVTAARGMGAGLAGILGLLFDQEHGLIFFAPIYVMSAAGAWSLWRDPVTRQDATFLTLIYLGNHLVVGTYWDWVGGASPVPRYLVPGLPVLGIFVARAVGVYWKQRRRLQPVVLGLASVAITGLILYERRFMFATGEGSNVFLRNFSRMSPPASALLIRAFPSFWTAKGPGVYVQLAALLVVLFAFWLLCDRANRLLFRVGGYRA